MLILLANPNIIPSMSKPLSDRFRVRPHHKVHLADRDPDATPGFKDKDEAAKLLEKNIACLDDLGYRLAAESQHALLIVLQGMDAAGKDGTIRHVMTGLNPQNCRVTSFKVPTPEERSHDFLWRIHKAVPAKGEIGIFNRSHYEDVLVARVKSLVPKKTWQQRYEVINTFEHCLRLGGVTILKFFLHISQDEQKKRLLARRDDPAKNWKLSPSDIEERKYWDDYQQAYEAALAKCSTDDAPWFVIPANKKWYRNLAVAQIIVEALEQLNPQFPKPTFDPKKIVVK